MLLRDVVYQLLDQHGLSHARTAEEADFSTFEIGLQQVDHLDAGEENFLAGSEFLEFRSFAVDGQAALAAQFAQAVDGIPHHIHHASAYLRARRHRDRGARALHLQPAAQAVGGIHRYATHGVLAYVLLNFYYQDFTVGLMHLECIVDGRQGGLLLVAQVEMHVHHRSDDLGNVSCNCWHISGF